MAKQQNINVQDLNKTEEPELIDQVYFWLVHHRNKVTTLLIIGVIVFLVFSVLNQRRESNFVTASNRFFTATQVYEEALGQHPWGSEERIQKMTEVRAIADEIINDFPDAPAARNALFLKGNSYFFEGEPLGQTTNTENAITQYQQYLNTASEGDSYSVASARLSLGYSYENLTLLSSGDQQTADAGRQALSFYDEVIAMENAGFLRYEAMVAKARLLYFNGSVDEAQEILVQVMRERGRFEQAPGAEASEDEQLLYQVRNLANQFTTGNTAQIMLRRMGYDVDALLEEIADSE